MSKHILVSLMVLFWFSISSSQESKQAFISDSLQANNYLKTLQEHYKKGNYLLHKNYSDSLLHIAKKNKFTKMHTLALINQGIYYKNRSEEHKTIALYHEALEKCKLIPNDFRTKTVVLVNLGNTYNNIGSYKKSIETMKSVIKVANSVKGSDTIKAAALIGLCDSYTELNNYEKVLDYANQAIDLGKKNKNEFVIATALNMMSHTYIEKQEYTKAKNKSLEALKLNYLKKVTRKRASVLLNLGESYFKLQEIDKAIPYLNEAKKIAIEKDVIDIQMYCHMHLAKIHELKGNFKTSNEEQKLYIKAKDIYTKDKNKATKIDLNKEITNKNIEIENAKTNLSSIDEHRKQLIIWSSIIGVLLISILVFYINRNKTIKKEQQKLRNQYTSLKKTITTLEANSRDVQETNTLKQKSKANIASYTNSSLTEQDKLDYKKHILDYMKKEKPYLNGDLKQSDLAEKLNLSSHNLSEILNFSFDQNFYNFVNSYRIIEAQKLIKNQENKNTKMLTIAFDSGFKSKTSFNRIFKKHTGLTPTEYKETIQ